MARSELTRELPFERELLEDIYQDLLAYLLLHTPSEPLYGVKTRSAYKQISYPGTKASDWFWSTPKGLSLTSQWLFQGVSPPHLYLAPELATFSFRLPKNHAYVATFDRGYSGVTSYDPWVRFALTGTGLQCRWLERARPLGRRLLISAEYLPRIRQLKVIPKTFLESITIEWQNKDWALLRTKVCPRPTVSFQKLARHVEPHLFTMLAEWYFDQGDGQAEDDEDVIHDEAEEEDVVYEYSYRSGPLRKPSLLAPVWRQLFGDKSWIPFEPDERKRVCKSAYHKLRSYLRSHEHATRP